MTETVSPEMVERMIALVRGMSADDIDVHRAFYEACCIAAELPAPVDPDHANASLIMAEHEIAFDDDVIHRAIMEGIKRGRALAGEAQSEWGFKPASADTEEQAAAWVIHTMKVDGFMFANQQQADELALRAVRHGRTLATQGDR